MIASAFLHATWNAWVKSRRDSNAAVACLVIGAGFPNLVVIAAFGWPAAPAWPWIACTVTLSIGSLTLLAKAYREGDFAVAFPMIRGAIPVVLVAAAVPLFDEKPQVAGAPGVVSVSAGLVLIGWESRAAAAPSDARPRLRRGGGAHHRGLGHDGREGRAPEPEPGRLRRDDRRPQRRRDGGAEASRGHNVTRMLVREWPVTFYAARSALSYKPFIWSLPAAGGARRRDARDQHAVRAVHRLLRAPRALRRLALGRGGADARRHAADAALTFPALPPRC